MRATLWAFVAIAALGVSCAFASLGLSLDASSSIAKIAFMAGIVVLAAMQHRLTSDRLRTLADFLECFGLFTAVSLLGGLSSYAVVIGTHGYVDDLLAAADRTLGFDWVAQYAFLARHPLLTRIAAIAYSSIIFSPPIILAALVWSKRGARAIAFVLAFAISLAMTVAIFRFFPARAALAHYIGMHPNFLPVIGLRHVEVIEQLRGGALTHINLDAMVGIISFPSFHAVAALLFVWAAWPIRWLRLPMLATNAAMLAATPVHGTHYLIEILAGLAVAVAAIGMLGLPAWARSQLRGRAIRGTRLATA